MIETALKSLRFPGLYCKNQLHAKKEKLPYTTRYCWISAVGTTAKGRIRIYIQIPLEVSKPSRQQVNKSTNELNENYHETKKVISKQVISRQTKGNILPQQEGDVS